MKRYLIVFASMILVAATGCKKNDDAPPTHQPEPLALDDARTILLKDAIAERLPSPFFHFEYDDQKYVKQIVYASGLATYDVEYENKRVKKMIRTGGTRNSMVYSYNDNKVSEINEFSEITGEKLRSYKMSYNNKNQLTQVLWYEFSTNSNGVLFKKQDLTYQTDGNLASIEHYISSTGPLVLVRKDLFSDYDNTTCVDDFNLLENFFDSFLFLPQVRLQKNNPTRQQILGGSTEYDIFYTYDFQNNLPVKRNGLVLMTSGIDKGKSVEIVNRYTYY